MMATRTHALATGSATRTPVHLWVVGVLSLLWHALGCYDYLMTNMRVEGYIAQIPPDMIDFLDAFPGWLVVGWGAEMGLGVLGSLLLLARSRWAVYAFALQVVLMAASEVYQLSVGLPRSMTTPGYWSMVALIWIVALALLSYALRMRARGVLR